LKHTGLTTYSADAHGRRQDFCCVGQRGAEPRAWGTVTGHMSLASSYLGACWGRAEGTWGQLSPLPLSPPHADAS